MKVLITGCGGPAGEKACEHFGLNGFDVVAIDCNPKAFDKVIADKCYEVPEASDPDFSNDMMKLIKDEDIDFVIPTVTEELYKWACMASSLRFSGIGIAIGNPDSVLVANDKLLTAYQLQMSGVGAPKTMDSASNADAIVELLGLPCLTKPRAGRGGRGVMVHNSKTDLLRPEIDRHGEVVYQEFLNGPEYNVSLFISDRGELKAMTTMRKLALKEGLTGNALSVEEINDEEVGGLALRACEALKLTGPLDVDIREGSKGLGVLEVNARLGATVSDDVLKMLEKYALEGFF